MAQTLVEASKLSNDVLQKGILELLAKDDPILEQLPFIEILGNGLTYNVETTRSTAQFHGVGDTWVESTPTVTSATAALAILGDDADVDGFLKATRANINDLMQEAIISKTLSIKESFGKEVLYGNLTDGITLGFDGLHYLVRRNGSTAGSTNVNPNTVAVATTSGTSKLLNLHRLDYAIDLVKGESPASLILMSKQMRRYLNVYLRSVGAYATQDFRGKIVQEYGGLPIAVSDLMRDNESADLQYGVNEAGTAVYGHNHNDTDGGDDDGGTSIFVVSFGPKALQGIQAAGGITTVNVGDLETKDAIRKRLKWYCGLMLQNVLSVTKVTGIDVDGVGAA